MGEMEARRSDQVRSYDRFPAQPLTTIFPLSHQPPFIILAYMWPFIPFCLSFLIDAQLAHAGRVPFQVRYAQPRALSERAEKSTIPIKNTFNAEYISTITLGTRTVPVLLDTGKWKPLNGRISSR